MDWSRFFEFAIGKNISKNNKNKQKETKELNLN